MHYNLLLGIYQTIQNSITENLSHQSLLLASTRSFRFHCTSLLFRENFIPVTFGILIRPRRDASVFLLLSLPWEDGENDWLRPFTYGAHGSSQSEASCVRVNYDACFIVNQGNKGQMEEFGHSDWRHFDSCCGDYITSHLAFDEDWILITLEEKQKHLSLWYPSLNVNSYKVKIVPDPKSVALSFDYTLESQVTHPRHQLHQNRWG